MKAWQIGLTIQNQHYSFKDLLAYSSDQIVSAQIHPWEKEIFRFIINWLSDSDYLVQFSSGTTGKYKEIRLPKISMMDSAMNTCRFFGLTKEQTTLLCMPVDFIAGKMMVIRSMVGGLNLLVTEPKSVPDLSGHPSIDFCSMVPLQIMNLLACHKDLDLIKKLIIGGAEITTELETLIQDISTEVYATYGMAETCSHVALKKLNGPFRQYAYHAMQGVALSSDDRGCLIIDADYLPDRIVTNDLVEFTGSGSFNWLGRYDNLINSGGIKIVPEEVEAMILSKMMLECAVIGLPDTILGHRLVFVFEKDHAPDSFSSLKADFEDHLPRHWRPKDIVCMEKLPRNKAWKVDRRMLSEMLSVKQP
jgi:O-succinylbenzoic acid--CoA ligase